MHVARDRLLEWALMKEKPECFSCPEAVTLPPHIVSAAPGRSKQDSFDPTGSSLLEHTMIYSKAPRGAFVFIHVIPKHIGLSLHQEHSLYQHPCDRVVSSEHRNPHCGAVSVVHCKSIKSVSSRHRKSWRVSSEKHVASNFWHCWVPKKLFG